MTETTLVALAGIAATLLGSLGATWLANGNARRVAAEQRKFERQERARLLVVSIVTAARTWQQTASIVTLFLGARNSRSEADAYLQDGLPDSFTGTELRDRGQELTRAATEAMLLIAEPPLRDAIDTLVKLHAGWWEFAVAPIIKDLDARGTDKVERLRPSFQFEKAFSDTIDKVEALAREAIASEIGK